MTWPLVWMEDLRWGGLSQTLLKILPGQGWAEQAALPFSSMQAGQIPDASQKQLFIPDNRDLGPTQVTPGVASETLACSLAT